MNSVELHERLLKMMKEFHIFCEKEGLTYYMVGGTCLGAIRHGGFIPWDDDMDIGMPRNDYERLASMDMSKLPGSLEIKFYRNTDNCPIHYMKLVDSSTTLIEAQYTSYLEGLYIDVFPLDGVKNHGKLEQLRFNKIWYTGAIIRYKMRTDVLVSPKDKIKRYVAKLFELGKLHNNLDKLMKKYNYEECNYTANFLGAWREKEIVRKDMFGIPTKYRFEDTYLYGPQKPDEYLQSIYGDYMQLPPKEKRVCKHDYYYLDLHHSYKDYEKGK